jgi:hypothetical protein
VVVEGLERLVADLQHTGESSRSGIAFEDPDIEARPGEPVGGSETGESCAYDRDIIHVPTARPILEDRFDV